MPGIEADPTQKGVGHLEAQGLPGDNQPAVLDSQTTPADPLHQIGDILHDEKVEDPAAAIAEYAREKKLDPEAVLEEMTQIGPADEDITSQVEKLLNQS